MVCENDGENLSGNSRLVSIPIPSKQARGTPVLLKKRNSFPKTALEGEKRSISKKLL